MYFLINPIKFIELIQVTSEKEFKNNFAKLSLAKGKDKVY